MVKVIWVAGMPRSGSMWTFNVVRELARSAGFRVLPEHVPLSDPECCDYANGEVRANRDPDTVFVLKTHGYLSTLPPGDLVITNIRDIRDALMSYMRFMHADFETALAVAEINAELADRYLALPDDRRMVLRYDEITAEPASAVARLADRLELPVDDTVVARTADKFGKEKVGAQIESRDRRCRQSIERGQAPADGVLISRADGTCVTIDLSTGFQTGHVSDYRDGDWRRLLSGEQIGAMNRAFGDWLTRNGYAH